MATVFSEDFEGGANGATLTSGNSAYSTFGGTTTFDNSTHVTGSQSAKMSPAGGAAISVRQTVSPTVTHRFFRRYFRINALPTPGNIIVLMRVRNAGTSYAQISVLATSGFITVRDVNTTVATSTNAITLNTWFRVEWEVDVTNSLQNCRLFFGANFSGTTPTETLPTGAYSSGFAIDRVDDGVGQPSYSGSMWIDAVADDDTTWPGPAGGANAPPTANAGPDQTVVSTQTVTLDGSASSDDGSVTGYAWTQLSGTAVTLSNSAAVQPTFTAPTVSGSPITLVFGLIVTDNLSVQSTQDTVTITVNPPPVSDFSEDFETGPDGAAITISNTAYTLAGGTIAFNSLAVVTGSLGCLFTSTGGTAPVLTENFLTTVTSRYFRRYFLIAALPTTFMTLARVRFGANTTAQIVLDSNGKLELTNIAASVGTSTVAIAPNTWFRVEWFIDGTTTNTQTLKIFVLGNYNGSTPSDTINAVLYNQGQFDRIVDGIGTPAAYTGTLAMDSVADNVGSYVGPAAGANAAPTANAGTDQSVTATSTVTLTGTASADSGGGTVVAYVWKQTSGTAVTLSSNTVSQPTFTAPSANVTLVFSLYVIDDKGAASNTDSVTITVSLPVAPFSENFEGGSNGTAITTSNTAYTTQVTGNVTFDSSTTGFGTLSAKCVSTGTVAAFMRESFGATTERYLRRYVRFSVLPAGSTPILRIRSGGASRGQVSVNSTGHLELRDAAGTTVLGTSTNTYAINTWIRLEWHIDGTTTNTQALRVYTGNLLNSPTIQNETVPAPYTAGSFTVVDDGSSNAAFVGTVWVDEAVDQTSTWPGPAVGANQPPVVYAGSDQLVLPGSLVTLDGTGSTDLEGPIASYSWSKFSGTSSITLSSSTAAQPTFTAPSLATGDVLVFHLVVTDSGGVTSQIGSVTVAVQPANEYVLKSGTWQISPPTLM